ncbi:hypothetical protein [Streptomyces platensis]
MNIAVRDVPAFPAFPAYDAALDTSRVLPDSLGAEITLDVGAVLAVGRP